MKSHADLIKENRHLRRELTQAQNIGVRLDQELHDALKKIENISRIAEARACLVTIKSCANKRP